MKQLFICAAALLVAHISMAQTIEDALRYSTKNTTGTARYRAMSGAFGALGGDLSAVSDNPAASAVFTKSAFTLSLSSDRIANDASYFGTTDSSDEQNLAVNQLGGVFVFDTPNSKWKKFTFGLNYDRTQNFDDQIGVLGTSAQTIGDYFLNFAQGVPLDLLQLRDGETIDELYQFLGENEGFGAQQAFLGFQSFLIDPFDFDDPNNTAYFSNVLGNTFTQDYLFSSEGYNGKASFNIAAQYEDDLYLGLNLNSQFFDYEQATSLVETNPNAEGITAIQFDNFLRTFGSGFSFQLGAIYRVGENVRLGATYDSPTWITVSEEGSQRVLTDRIEDGLTISESIDPNVLNVYQDYELVTPSNFNASFAYLFGQKGLISFDYTFTNYAGMRFRPKSDAFFSALNDAIDNSLTGAGTYRLGGEYRHNQWSFRAGARYIESPYENNEILDHRNGYSLGFGYNFGNTKLDFAYDNAEQSTQQSLYSTGLTNAPQLDKRFQSFVASLTVSF